MLIMWQAPYRYNKNNKTTKDSSISTALSYFGALSQMYFSVLTQMHFWVIS